MPVGIQYNVNCTIFNEISNFFNELTKQGRRETQTANLVTDTLFCPVALFVLDHARIPYFSIK